MDSFSWLALKKSCKKQNLGLSRTNKGIESRGVETSCSFFFCINPVYIKSKKKKIGNVQGVSKKKVL